MRGCVIHNASAEERREMMAVENITLMIHSNLQRGFSKSYFTSTLSTSSAISSQTLASSALSST